jgi:hypothetical protein
MARESAPAIIENRLELENEPDSDDQEIKRLATLPIIQYGRERKIVAQRLGINVAALDDAVRIARGDSAGTMGQGRPVEIHEVEAWPEPVNGAVLLDEVCRELRSYVVLSDAQADGVTLWCVHTHTHDAADVSPKLVIRSVQKRSGKTRLATALARLVVCFRYPAGSPAADCGNALSHVADRRN